MASRHRLFIWSRVAASKWEDAWRETLRYLGETRLAVIAFPRGRRIRLELYSLSLLDAKELVRHFGGRIRPQPSTAALVRQTGRTAPVNVRGRLIIACSAAAARAAVGARKISSLVIPAGVAFGTGAHLTTVSCLRLLADVASGMRGRRWAMLDVGSGSGILALAAVRLGAFTAEGFDYDADAVRTAKENAALNGISNVSFMRRDVIRWEPARVWDVVSANLFQSVLLQTAEKLAAAVAPGGWLIVSGLLHDQETEVITLFRKEGMKPERILRRGQWVAISMRRATLRRAAVRGPVPPPGKTVDGPD